MAWLLSFARKLSPDEIPNANQYTPNASPASMKLSFEGAYDVLWYYLGSYYENKS